MKLYPLLIFLFCINTEKITAQNNSKPESETDYDNNKSTGKYYNIRGIKMYCEVYGKGEPLLLIHGNGGSIKSFSNQIPFFSKYYKVIAVDSRAQGKTIDTGDSLSYKMMADDFAALLDVMKIDSAYVIGWSDGGINSLLLAIRHPDKVKKLASTGANLVPDSSALAQKDIDEMITGYNEMNSKKEKTADDIAQMKLLKLMIDHPHIYKPDLVKIKCPALIIGGDHDIIKPSHTLYIYENIPGAFLWIVPNSGHATLIEHKDDFNKTVYNFFKN